MTVLIEDTGIDPIEPDNNQSEDVVEVDDNTTLEATDEVNDNTESEDTPDEKADEADDVDEVGKWKKFARQHENDKKKLASEKEALEGELENLRNELNSVKREATVKDIVSELGLNEKQTKFLTGESREELLASGKELLEAFGGKPTQSKSFKQGANSDDISIKEGKITRANAYKDYLNRINNI